ncbi:hypothetical protein RYX36_026030, partial [Vicia faba]
MVKQCGIRPLCVPFDITQSLNEEVISREVKRAYHDFEYNRVPREYWLLRHYAHPLDCLGFPSKQPRISECHDGQFGEPIPPPYCADSVDEIQMEHTSIGDIHAEVFVYFGLN